MLYSTKKYSFLKTRAIRLRLKGHSYSEILKDINVSKSTLSLWLRGVCLTDSQQLNIRLKKHRGQKRGAFIRMASRISRENILITDAAREIRNVSKRELFLIGVALHWSEGSKSKDYNPSVGVKFSNSDPLMILVYLKWLHNCLRISSDRIFADIYIHESHKQNIEMIKDKWCQTLGRPHKFIRHVYYKKEKVKSNRRVNSDLYIGLLRVNISASSELNRKIVGWIRGIVKQWGVV